MKTQIKLLIGVGALLLAGCTAPLGTQVFNTENVVATGATGATHAFNAYYAQQTNPSPALVAARTDLYTADKNLSLTLDITESLREEYVTNSTSTNATAMVLSLDVAQSQQTNIVALVKNIMTAVQ